MKKKPYLSILSVEVIRDNFILKTVCVTIDSSPGVLSARITLYKEALRFSVFFSDDRSLKSCVLPEFYQLLCDMFCLESGFSN